MMPDLRPELPRLDIPVLTIAGELDEKFDRIGKEITAAVPDGRHVTIPGATHSLHLEAGAACADAWSQFIFEIKNHQGDQS